MDDNRSSILIVDDEKANIIALTHMLGQDYTIYAAKNGNDAIETAKEHLPDLILLDIIMPELDGYEVLSRLKEDDQTKHIPVIFITGLGNPENEEKGYALGAADYIGKPFNSSMVKQSVKKLLEK